MMLQKIEHIGIAVRDLDQAIPHYEKLLGCACYKTEIVETEGVKTAFFRVGESKIELLASLHPDGVIARYIDKKGEGIHHIAYDVADIYHEMQRLQSEGFTLISDKPKVGADNKLVCFAHPKSTGGVLVELCMENRTAP